MIHNLFINCLVIWLVLHNTLLHNSQAVTNMLAVTIGCVTDSLIIYKNVLQKKIQYWHSNNRKGNHPNNNFPKKSPFCWIPTHLNNFRKKSASQKMYLKNKHLLQKWPVHSVVSQYGWTIRRKYIWILGPPVRTKFCRRTLSFFITFDPWSEYVS